MRRTVLVRRLAVTGVVVVGVGLWLEVDLAAQPAKPTGVMAEPGAGSMTLTWTDPNDTLISYYSYRWRVAGGVPWEPVVVIADSGRETTRHVVTGLVPSRGHEFDVRSHYSNSFSQWSETVFGTPLQPAPSVPQNLRAVSSEGGVILYWSRSYDVNIAGYRYRQSSDGGTTFVEQFMQDSGRTTASYVIENLTPGTMYTFGIRAENDTANSGWSANVTVTAAVLPAAPTSLTAVAGEGTVTLAWADPGDTTITKYRYRQSADGGATFTEHEIAGAGADTTSYVVRDLAGGVEYIFEIQAGNSVGWSVSSFRVVVRAGGRRPAAPTGLTAVAGEGTVTLAWADPGDTTITKYRYRQSADGGATFSEGAIPGAGADTTSYVVRDLAGGVEYIFEIQAGNSVGWSVSSFRVVVRAGGRRPAAPTGLTAVAGEGTVTLAWADPGDTTITKYRYRQSADGGATFSERAIPGAGADTTSYVVRDLAGGVEYIFEIQAGNSVGWSVSSFRVVVRAGGRRPAAPTGLMAVAGEGTVTLAWADPGDTTITKYRYRQSADGGATFSEGAIPGAGADTTSYVVRDLAGGVEYIFEIQAGNSVGWSVSSFRVVVRAGGRRPAAPTGLTAVAGEGTVTLAWADPGDTTITKYRYRQSADGGATFSERAIPGAGANTTTYVISGLVGGTAYTLRLRAENSAGVGEWSAAVTVEPVVQQVTVSWSAAAYEVTEGAEAAEIEVVLSEAAERVVTVPVTMALDGGAAWEDFSAVPESVVFDVGSTTAVLEVVAVADDDDDPDERMMLEFGPLPDGVSLGPVPSAVVTVQSVRSRAAMEGMLGVTLAAVAGAVADSAQTAIERRFEHFRRRRRGVTEGLGGQVSDVRAHGGASVGRWDQGAEEARWPEGGILRGPGVPGGARLVQRPFDLVAIDSGPRAWGAAVWGGGDLQRLAGVAGGVTYDAAMRETMIGVDVHAARVLAGVTYMRTAGRVTYGEGVAAAVGADLHTLHPYVYGQVSEDVGVWGLVGFGVGSIGVADLGLADDARAAYRSVAAGVRAVVARRGETEWGVRADVSRAGLDTMALENISAVEGAARRTRVMVDFVHDRALGGRRSLSVQVEGGVRVDRGGAGDGKGVETGVRVGWLDAGSGVDVTVDTRVLVMHELELRQWGIGVSGSWDPGLRGRGARLTVSRALGADAGGQIGIWDSPAAGAPRVGVAPAGGAAGELAYGVDVWGGVLTPYYQRVTGRGRAVNVGASWFPPAAGWLWSVERRGARGSAGFTETAFLVTVSRVF